MTTSFRDFLTQQKADVAMIQEAAIQYVGEVTDDLPPEELRAKVAEVVGDPARVEAALEEVRHDAGAAENILLTMFANAWEDPGEHERIRRAFEAARTHFAVIETIVIGSVVLYGMYLTAYFVSGGKKKQVRTVKRGADGSIEETTQTEWVPPATPHSAVGYLYSAIGNKLLGG